MLLTLTALSVALVVGWARGGSLERLGRLPLRRRSLVIAAVAVQGLGAVVGGVAYPVGLGLSALLVAAFLALNRGTPGTGLVALGLLCNALVVALNGAMPVSLAASDRARLSTQAILAGEDPRHELADRHSRLRPLGDVVPVLLPFRPEVVSPGDVLVAAGLAELLVVGMGRRRGRRVAPRT